MSSETLKDPDQIHSYLVANLLYGSMAPLQPELEKAGQKPGDKMHMTDSCAPEVTLCVAPLMDSAELNRSCIIQCNLISGATKSLSHLTRLLDFV